MAGIYIPNNTMPKDCPVCPVSYWSITDGFCGCGIVPGKRHAMKTEHGYAESNEKPDWCPLVEVPDHGRLIDADALTVIIKEYIEEYSDTDENGWHSGKWCAMKEAEMAINDAPTIRPAEEKT